MEEYLSEAELKRVLRHVPRPHRLMVLVTYWHGLRATETVKMRGKQIQGGKVWVKRLKGSKETVQPFMVTPDPELEYADQLTRLALTKKPEELVFSITTRDGFYKIMRKAGAAAGIPAYMKVRTHILKHTIANHLVDKNVQLNAVQAHLGHESLRSTGRYLRMSSRKSSVIVAEAMGCAIVGSSHGA